MESMLDFAAEDCKGTAVMPLYITQLKQIISSRDAKPASGRPWIAFVPYMSAEDDLAHEEWTRPRIAQTGAIIPGHSCTLRCDCTWTCPQK
jgi:hypothetical protein